MLKVRALFFDAQFRPVVSPQRNKACSVNTLRVFVHSQRMDFEKNKCVTFLENSDIELSKMVWNLFFGQVVISLLTETLQTFFRNDRPRPNIARKHLRTFSLIEREWLVKKISAIPF